MRNHQAKLFFPSQATNAFSLSARVKMKDAKVKVAKDIVS